MSGERRVLDEETRRKLAGVISFSPDAEVKIDPYEDSDIAAEDRPLFWVHPYTRAEKTRITSLQKQFLTSEGRVKIDDKAMEILFGLVRSKVVRWAQVFDGTTGEEIAFEADELGQVRLDLWDRAVPETVRSRLLTALSVISGLREPEKLSLRS